MYILNFPLECDACGSLATCLIPCKDFPRIVWGWSGRLQQDTFMSFNGVLSCDKRKQHTLEKINERKRR